MRSAAWLVLAVIAGVFIGMSAYNVGLSHGAAQAALAQAAPAGAAAGTLPPYAYGWGWHAHGGAWFPVFFLIFFWFVAFGMVGPWRRRYWRHPYGDVPPSFEDWHRRAHERMGQDTTPRQP